MEKLYTDVLQSLISWGVLKKLKPLFIFCGVLTTFSSAHARTYDWLAVPAEDLRVVTDSDLEQTLRLLLISKATQRLDIVTFDQRNDPEYGHPTLQAIREAANRGVKVRFMTSWVSSVFDEYWRNDIATFLTVPVTRSPIEYLLVGGGAMSEYGFLHQDTIHEKLLIVDGKWALMTGRGQTSAYRNWLDTAYLTRGKMVLQFSEAFEELWRFVEPRNGIQIPEPGEPVIQDESLESHRKPVKSETKRNIKAIARQLEPQFSSELKSLKDWLNEPVRSVSNVLREEVPTEMPLRIRLHHHDLLSQLDLRADVCNELPCDLGTGDRLGFLSDPVIESVLEGLKDQAVTEFRYSTLAMTLNPRLKELLLQRMQTGLRVKILTNSKESHTAVIPYPAGWYAGLDDMKELAQAGAEIYVLKSSEETSFRYVHQKLGIAGRSRTWVGSHNFTRGSTAHTDEMSIEVESQAFAEKMIQIFEENLMTHGQKLEVADFENDMGFFFRFLKRPIFTSNFAISLI